MRINFVNALLGGRGSGKTYYSIELIKKYAAAHPSKKILVVDTLDHPSYKLVASIDIDLLKRWKKPAIYRIYGSNTEEIIKAIEENMSNSLIIFEDASKYVGKLMEKNFRTMIFDSKQRNNDIIFIFHGFMATPPELYRLVDNIVLFRTGDSPANRKNSMVTYTEIEKAYQKIIASSEPYPNETIKIY